MPNYMVNLRNSSPITAIGGKAHALSILLGNGFNVPEGSVVTSAAFFYFLRHNGALAQIEKLASGITWNNFKERSQLTREVILSGEVPADITSKINASLDGLDATRISVRSSAVSEDGLKSSFAGLFDTFLNVRAELPLVLESVKKCWTSLFSDRAVAYRIRKAVPHLEGMAVILQSMVPAEVSGVVLTEMPNNQDRSLLVIESSWGLGESLVSGSVSPDRFILRRSDLEIVDHVVGSKGLGATAQAHDAGKVGTQKLHHGVVSLEKDLARTLAGYCLEIERLFGRPQDIEWCIAEGRIWILQARPITSVRG